MIREFWCPRLSRRVGEDIIGRVKDSCLLPRAYSGDVRVSTSSHHGSVEECVGWQRLLLRISKRNRKQLQSDGSFS